MRLGGKIAVITGGGSGFGRATSIRFTQEGARVLAVDVNAEGAAETARLAGAIAKKKLTFFRREVAPCRARTN